MEPTTEGLASRCAIADDHDVGRLLTVGAISSPHEALGASCVVPVGRGIDPFAYVRRCISPGLDPVSAQLLISGVVQAADAQAGSSLF
jgi:hypothetical protein